MTTKEAVRGEEPIIEPLILKTDDKEHFSIIDRKEDYNRIIDKL